MAINFGRACFDLAEFATNKTERADLAEQGIAACRKAVTAEPKQVAGHYYLAMNLGQLARTKGLGALSIVDEMEEEFKSARELDAKFHYAGPDRNLGQLYRDAPVLASVGSRSKARKQLSRAVELAPGFPENRLLLAEGLAQWGDRNGARRELRALEAGWGEAKQKFNGPEWDASWLDWNARLEKLRQKLGEEKKLETPRRPG